MNSDALVCAFTGHRPKSLPWGNNESDARCVKLKRRIRAVMDELVADRDRAEFITGMALGADTICAEIVLELKGERSGIILTGAIPFRDQAVRWNGADKERRARK